MKHTHARTHTHRVLTISVSLANSITARGGPWPPSRVSSILPCLVRLLSNFYTLPLLHLPSLHLPNAAWVSLWGNHSPGSKIFISSFTQCLLHFTHCLCAADFPSVGRILLGECYSDSLCMVLPSLYCWMIWLLICWLVSLQFWIYSSAHHGSSVGIAAGRRKHCGRGVCPSHGGGLQQDTAEYNGYGIWQGAGEGVEFIQSRVMRRRSGFGGLGVSVLAFSTQVCGFKPGRSRRIFKGEKILSTPSFRGEVKLSVPYCRFAACKKSLNVAWKSTFRQNYQIFLTHRVPPFSTRGLSRCVDVGGGAPGDRSGNV